MSTAKIVFKFEEKTDEYVFENKINVISDKNLIRDLGKENIKNEGSTLSIVSSNNLPIYDVVQLKINLEDTGVFLVNFEKEKLSEEQRNDLIEKIKKLKDGVEPTKETQLAKIEKLFSILKDFEILYVSYRNFDYIRLFSGDFGGILEKIQFSFPLLLLEKPVKIKETKPAIETNKKLKLTKQDFINGDFLFISVFSILFCYGLTTGVYEALAKEGVAIFLLILSTIFIGILYYTGYSSLYRKNKEINKYYKFTIIPYLIIGMAIGIIAAYFISTKVIKLEDDQIINTSQWFKISLPICIPLAAITPLVSILISKIIQLFKKQK